MEHICTSYDETTTDPFGDMETYTIYGDIEPNTLNVSLLINSATTDTIIRDKKYFFVSRSYNDISYHHHHW